MEDKKLKDMTYFVISIFREYKKLWKEKNPKLDFNKDCPHYEGFKSMVGKDINVEKEMEKME